MVEGELLLVAVEVKRTSVLRALELGLSSTCLQRAHALFTAGTDCGMHNAPLLCLQNAKMWGIVAAVITLLIYFILALACGPTLKGC